MKSHPFLSTFIVLFVVVILLPLVLLSQISTLAGNWGLKEYLHPQSSLAEVDISLWNATLTVNELQIGAKESPDLLLEHLHLGWSWRSLWDKKIVLQTFKLQRLQSTFAMNESGEMRVAGHPLPASEGSENKASKNHANSEEVPPWGIEIGNVDIAAIEIALSLPQLSGKAHLDRLQLDRLQSWQPQKPTHISIKAGLDQNHVALDLQLTPLQLQQPQQIDLKIEIPQLSHFMPLLKEQLQKLEGGVKGDLSITLKEGESGSWHLDPKGEINLHDIALEQEQVKLKLPNLLWQSDLTLQLGLTGEINLDGTQRLELLINDLETAEATIPRLALKWDGKTQFAATATNWSADIEGGLGLTKIGLEHSQIDLENLDMAWNGNLHAASNSEGLLSLTKSGNMGLENIKGRLTPKDITFALNSLQWQGELSHQDEKSQLQGTLSLHGLDTTRQQHRLLQLNQIALNQVMLKRSASAVALSLANIDIGPVLLSQQIPDGIDEGSVAASEQTPPLLALQRLTLKQPQLNEAGLISIEAIEIESLESTLAHLESGEWQQVGPLLQLAERKETETETAPEDGVSVATETVIHPETGPNIEAAVEPKKIPLYIGAINISGENRILFRDDTLSPPYKTLILADKIQIGTIDGHKPQQPTPLEIALRVDEYATVKMEGEVSPLLSPPNLQLSAAMRQFELPPLSSFTIPSLGYALQSGQLDNDLTLKIDNGVIEGESTLLLRKLVMEPADQETVERFSKKLSMPLDSALSILRDDQENITLKIPLSGNIDDPVVDPQDAINTALGKAMKFAALHYLKNSIQPYGTLITLVSLAGDLASRISLDPLIYPAGSSELGKESKEYLQKVTGLMGKRPEIQISLCGYATSADRESMQALRQQSANEEMQRLTKTLKKGEKVTEIKPKPVSDDDLRALAKERGDQLKRELVKHFKIEANRLLVCHPMISPVDDKEAKPRIELLI